LRAKRWQDDRAFVAWLVGQRYASMAPAGQDAQVQPYLSLGSMLYLYEAWQAGIQNEKTRQAD